LQQADKIVKDNMTSAAHALNRIDENDVVTAETVDSEEDNDMAIKRAEYDLLAEFCS